MLYVAISERLHMSFVYILLQDVTAVKLAIEQFY